MGVLDWLFNGGDDRAAAHSDLDNTGAGNARQARLYMRQKAAESRAKGANKNLTKTQRDAAAARQRGHWGTSRGSHPRGGGWWD